MKNKVVEEKGEKRELRDAVLAGVAVMVEDAEKAQEVLDGIKADGTIDVMTGSWYTTYAATSDVALDGLSDFQLKLEEKKLRHSLALSVPVDRFQTEASVVGGVGKRTFCSVKGLPFQTKKEREALDNHYNRLFKRPSFWLVDVVVDIAGNTNFSGQLYGQYRNENGQLEYRPIVDVKTGEVISQNTDSLEEAQEKFHVNENFLFAMIKSIKDLIEIQRRRQGLRAAVYPTPPPLTASIGELAETHEAPRRHQPRKGKERTKAEF